MRISKLSGGRVARREEAVLLLVLNNGLAIEEFTQPATVPRDLRGTVLQALVVDQRGTFDQA